MGDEAPFYALNPLFQVKETQLSLNSADGNINSIVIAKDIVINYASSAVEKVSTSFHIWKQFFILIQERSKSIFKVSRDLKPKVSRRKTAMSCTLLIHGFRFSVFDDSYF